MSKVSVIIPCRGEQYQIGDGQTVLQRTVEDVFAKAGGDIEVIVVYDGPPYQDLGVRAGLTQIWAEWGGTKTAINRAATHAVGEYLFKLDAHCMVCESFDVILQEQMEWNWVVQPRFYVLDAEHWQWQDERFYDYFRLPCPMTDSKGFRFQAGGHWPERTQERLEVGPLDETMKLHGSSFFMARDFYWTALRGLDPLNGAGSWNGEDIELSLKTWLGPWEGRVMVNKGAWYAHMHRGAQRPREWGVSYSEAHRSALWTADYWMGNRWEARARDIEWFIERFMPVLGWPENWQELLDEWRRHG